MMKMLSGLGILVAMAGSVRDAEACGPPPPEWEVSFAVRSFFCPQGSCNVEDLTVERISIDGDTAQAVAVFGPAGERSEMSFSLVHDGEMFRVDSMSYPLRAQDAARLEISRLVQNDFRAGAELERLHVAGNQARGLVRWAGGRARVRFVRDGGSWRLARFSRPIPVRTRS